MPKPPVEPASWLERPQDAEAEPRDAQDSGWGEGAASALETLRKIEESRARSRPGSERPSGA